MNGWHDPMAKIAEVMRELLDGSVIISLIASVQMFAGHRYQSHDRPCGLQKVHTCSLRYLDVLEVDVGSPLHIANSPEINITPYYRKENIMACGSPLRLGNSIF
jgi:hypothetical protein